jgi:hypothetical protein
MYASRTEVAANASEGQHPAGPGAVAAAAGCSTGVLQAQQSVSAGNVHMPPAPCRSVAMTLLRTVEHYASCCQALPAAQLPTTALHTIGLLCMWPKLANCSSIGHCCCCPAAVINCNGNHERVAAGCRLVVSTALRCTADACQWCQLHSHPVVYAVVSVCAEEADASTASTPIESKPTAPTCLGMCRTTDH